MHFLINFHCNPVLLLIDSFLSSSSFSLIQYFVLEKIFLRRGDKSPDFWLLRKNGGGICIWNWVFSLCHCLWALILQKGLHNRQQCFELFIQCFKQPYKHMNFTSNVRWSYLGNFHCDYLPPFRSKETSQLFQYENTYNPNVYANHNNIPFYLINLDSNW